MRALAAEWIKTKRTAVRRFLFFLPLLYAALILGYIALRGVDQNTETLVFQLFFEAWTAFVVPLGAGILAGSIVQQEELAGHFTGFLSAQTPRRQLYLGKFALLAITMTASLFIAVLVLGIGMQWLPGASLTWPVFMAAALLAAVATLPVLALHLWASFGWGMGASIGISIGGMLMAALTGATSLGDQIWQYIPWAWPVRLAKLPGAYLLLTPARPQPPEIIAPGLLHNQMAMGLTAAALCLAAALLGGILWFNRWEGRKSYE